MRIDNILLGLIDMHPRISGYQLKAIINDSTGFFFAAHNSQIYPALGRIRKNGWATYETVVQDGKPNLKLYTLTDAGRAELDAWLCEPPEFPRSRDGMDYYFLKLIFMGRLEESQILEYIDYGIERISEFNRIMTEENLSIETDFISESDNASKDIYLKIWKRELAFILDDLQRKEDHLVELRKELAE